MSDEPSGVPGVEAPTSNDSPAPAAAPAPPGLDPARRKDRAIGLGIVVASFVATLAISYWSRHASTPPRAEEPEPPTTAGIAGWPGAVDPLQVLPLAREATPRITFRGMVAVGVKSDGTMDFQNESARIHYSFQSPAAHGPQPPRPAGTLPSRTYCGKQNVHVAASGLVADPDAAGHPCPVPWTDGLPPPRCGVRDVWAHALKKGADPKRLARVEYYRARGGPAWRFEIPGWSHGFSLYGDCATEISGSDAAGSVP